MSYCKSSFPEADFAVYQEFQSKLGPKYTSRPEASISLAREYMEKYPEFQHIGGIGTPLDVIDECLEQIAALQKPKHGGKRKGAGRKPAPSQLKRVPVPLIPIIDRIISQYKSCDLTSFSLLALYDYLVTQGFQPVEGSVFKGLVLDDVTFEPLDDPEHNPLRYKKVSDYFLQACLLDDFYNWAISNGRLAL
ncbi:hypothetical protein ACPFUK_000134 [Vibrio cholerae]